MKLWQILITLLVTIVLAGSVRGYLGNPSIEELNTNFWKDDGPLELSPERGRFALVYSVIEDNSLHYSLPVARFATPDLGYINGNFVSLFAPGVSYVVMPGYLLGKYLGASQIGTFAMISVFALGNFLLVMAISRLLNVGKAASMLGALIFLFATPAFAYAVTLYQHHVTVFLLLLSIYLLLRFKSNVWSLLTIWFICAASIVIDYPNLFLFFPVGLVAISKAFMVEKESNKYIFGVRIPQLLATVTIVLPLLFFLWFNYNSYGDGLQFSGTVQSIQNLGEDGQVQYMTDGNEEQTSSPDEEKSSVSFFDTRHMVNGLYTLLFSEDRGTLIFSPIILFGFLGFYFSYQKLRTETLVLFAVCVANLMLYSMWGDPYGGWAFGARYMIPSFAMLGIGCAYLFHHVKRNYIFFIIMVPILIYSLAVNTLGALTSNRIPPKIEVLGLEALSGRRERYSYGRAYEYILSDNSSSFVFHTWMDDLMTAMQYYIINVSVLSVIALSLVIGVILSRSKNHAKK